MFVQNNDCSIVFTCRSCAVLLIYACFSVLWHIDDRVLKDKTSALEMQLGTEIHEKFKLSEELK